MMINTRRLTGLTLLSLIGDPNLVGDAPVAALSTSLPPDLTVLELELTTGGLPVDYRNEVKRHRLQVVCRERCTVLGRR